VPWFRVKAYFHSYNTSLNCVMDIRGPRSHVFCIPRKTENKRLPCTLHLFNCSVFCTAWWIYAKPDCFGCI
jgi:hypothetical protein